MTGLSIRALQPLGVARLSIAIPLAATLALPTIAAAQSTTPSTASGTTAGVLAGTAAEAQAQAVPPTSNTERSDQSNGVGDIVVTAQRREERLVNVPIAITAQSAASLERAGITNLRELGNVTPGLVYTTQGGISAPTIRGIQSTLGQAGSEAPTAIYVDGVYQPNILANVLDIADVERIEVLKGPQGTLFGRNATAGAISIHTVEPSFVTKGEFTVSDGLYFGAKTSQDITTKGYITGPLVGDMLAGGFSGYYNHVPGYYVSDVTGRRTGLIDKYIIRGKLLFKPTANLSFLLAGSYAHRDDETAFAVQSLHANTNAKFYPDSIVPTQVYHVASPLRDSIGQLYAQQKAVSLKADWDLGSKIGTLTSLTAYSDIKARLIVDISAAYAPTCVKIFACIIYDEGYPGKTFQQELTFASAKYGNLSFVAGGFYFHDINTIISDINPPLTANGDVAANSSVYLVGTIKTRAAAGFGEATYDLADRLHFIAGIRYSWERRAGFGNIVPTFPASGPIVDTAWTPRASVRYEITPHANVYFTYSQGFKSGVLDTTGQTNTTVKPERVKSYEVGFKTSTHDFSLEAAAFYYDYRDLQVQFFQGNPPISLIGNAANAKIWGAELETKMQLSPDFSLNLTGAWLPEAKYTDFPTGVAYALPNSATGMTAVTVDASGHRMIKTPRVTASASLSYEHQLGNGSKVDGSATLAYTSHYFFDLLQRVDTGNYATLNAELGYTLSNVPVRLSVYGKNIADKKYFVGALLGNESDTPVYSPPREIGVQVNYKF